MWFRLSQLVDFVLDVPLIVAGRVETYSLSLWFKLMANGPACGLGTWVREDSLNRCMGMERSIVVDSGWTARTFRFLQK